MTSERCRHSRSWILGSGHYEWCFECGAFRSLRQVSGHESVAASLWCKPVGRGGDNPYSKLRARTDRWAAKR
jgi:hypothetical protein